MRTLMVLASIASISSTPTKKPYSRPRLRALASWYYDAGSTACRFHARYGIASRTLPCGSKVRLSHGGNSIVATVDDRGPYIYSRLFDLNPSTRYALGCPDLCYVSYSLL